MSVNILIIDDEMITINQLKRFVKRILPFSNISYVYTLNDNILDANLNADLIISEIELYGNNGFEIIKRARKMNPNVKIIFTCRTQQYAMEAYNNQVDGYLLKPIRQDDIINQIEHLKRGNDALNEYVEVRCFGNFEILKDNVPIQFKRTKTKELLAYLVDRKGAAVNLKEIAAVLYEDREYDRTIVSMIQNLKSDLIKTLENEGLQYIITKSHNSLSINVSKVYCDYYRYLNGELKMTGEIEYMSKYSWAEYTASWLSRKNN